MHTGHTCYFVSRPIRFPKLVATSMTRTPLGFTSHDIHKPQDSHPSSFEHTADFESVVVYQQCLRIYMLVYPMETLGNSDEIWDDPHPS